MLGRVATVFILAWWYGSVGATETERLWHIIPKTSSTEPFTSILVSRPISLTVSQVVTLPYADEHVFEGRVTQQHQHLNGDISYYLTDANGNHAIITTGTRATWARIDSSVGVFNVEAQYQYGSIRTSNTMRFHHNTTDVINTSARQAKADTPLISPSHFSPLPIDPIDSDAKAYVDILFVYTEAASALHNGDIETQLNYLLALTNEAFDNSGILMEARMVGAIETEYEETGDSNQSLSDIGFAQDDRLKFVADRRVELGADVVSFITTDDLCGVAFSSDQIIGQARSMYHLVSTQQLRLNNCQDDTFAHELGHNLGLAHSRPQDPDGGFTYHFGLGYGAPEAMATIMSYPQAFNANFFSALHFSNARGSCNGYPCGVERSDKVNGADAAFALNQVRFLVEAIYPQSPSLTTAESALAGIVDDNLRSCIADNIAQKQVRYAASIHELECSQRNLSNLDGIERFERLESLLFSGNQITDLSPLAALPLLSSINLTGNQISDLSPLSALPNINSLEISYNAITDIASLENAAHLRTFYLSGNPVTDITPIIKTPRRWLWLDLTDVNMPCWQLNYLRSAQLPSNATLLESGCDTQDDDQDYDEDGIANQQEVTDLTNPLVSNIGVGHLSFANTIYRVDEHANNVSVELARSGGTQGDLPYALTVVSKTATQGEDFQFEGTSGVINDGQNQLNVTLDIEDDTIFENTEYFEIHLSSSLAENIGEYAVTTIVIDDNENTIEWQDATFEGTEGERKVTLSAIRRGDLTQEARVRFNVNPVTAFWGQTNDYLLERGSITFASGEAIASVDMELVNDSIEEPEESFEVILSSPSGGNLGSQRIAIVSVTDGEDVPPPTPTPTPTPPAPVSPPSDSGGGSLHWLYLIYLSGMLGIRRRRDRY